MAIMFITHNLGVIAEMADEVAVMYLGKIVERAPVDDIFYDPKHPYTRALLESIPHVGSRTKERLQPRSAGMVPDPYSIAPGCPFHPRCASFMPGHLRSGVSRSDPTSEPDHHVRCYLYAVRERRP